jgi:hypothetical protein
MDDNWEIANFGNLSRNGTGDFDNDGLNDLEEYLAGTDPKDPSSNLKLKPVMYNGTSFVVSFTAVAGKSYRVQFSHTLAPGSWLNLADVAPQATTGPVQVTDANASSSTARFYRVFTPAAP